MTARSHYIFESGNLAVYLRAVCMTWFTWLLLAALVAAGAAVTGIKPSGTRQVERTYLMGAARFALVILLVVFMFLAFRARTGV